MPLSISDGLRFANAKGVGSEQIQTFKNALVSRLSDAIAPPLPRAEAQDAEYGKATDENSRPGSTQGTRPTTPADVALQSVGLEERADTLADEDAASEVLRAVALGPSALALSDDDETSGFSDSSDLSVDESSGESAL